MQFHIGIVYKFWPKLVMIFKNKEFQMIHKHLGIYKIWVCSMFSILFLTRMSVPTSYNVPWVHISCLNDQC
jgi:hypothetical protein